LLPVQPTPIGDTQFKGKFSRYRKKSFAPYNEGGAWENLPEDAQDLPTPYRKIPIPAFVVAVEGEVEVAG
jgi:hypothetical protein